MTSSDARVRMVGVDLQENDDSRAIVDAIEEATPTW
jgi:hypothetical protein